MRQILILSLLGALAVTGCKTTQIETAPVVIDVEPIETCTSVSALEKQVIPAVTKVRYAITQIENPPYEPIETTVKQTIVVTPAEIVYVDSEGRQALDICEDVEMGPIGPGPGELMPTVDGTVGGGEG